MQQFEVRWMMRDGTEKTTYVRDENRLSDAAMEAGIALEAACSGNGTCGKCLVRIVKGEAAVDEADKRVLSEVEIAKGIRLACRVIVHGPLDVCVVNNAAADIQAVGLEVYGKNASGSAGSCSETYCIAADLGTTTLAAVLTDAAGNVLAQTTAVNTQRRYGADVISRIQASNEGKKDELRACICRDLEQMFLQLCIDGGVKEHHIRKIAIAGNTAMLHLLRGYSCETLGRAPFVPVTLRLERLDYRKVFCNSSVAFDCEVHLLPGLSAFVGADITAGLFASGFMDVPETETALFLDLGTNGEMAVGNGEQFMTASTAAGPALEGAHLSCGVPGIPGAVSNVSFLYHRVRVQTIGQKKPCGICGSGALEAVAALLKEGLLDKNGLLAPSLFESGFVLAKDAAGKNIVLTQADIREIQMAKAAIRAGVDTLFYRFSEQTGKKTEPERIFLAGGLGCYLSAKTAAIVGLLPEEWINRIVVCGNSSLQGAVQYLIHPACARRMENLHAQHGGISLADDQLFQEQYVKAMDFGCV